MSGTGPLYAEVQRSVEARGLVGTVHMLGFVTDEEVRQLIGNCHAVLLPSSIEGRPYIVMESLAMGVPVVASRVGGLPDLIEPGYNGMLCPVDDYPAFAAALADLREDRTRYAQMRLNAREYALAHLDIRAMRDAYVTLFRELTSARTPVRAVERAGGNA
jgi:glycosyltransferase involved in cell wall biosynthesis